MDVYHYAQICGELPPEQVCVSNIITKSGYLPQSMLFAQREYYRALAAFPLLLVCYTANIAELRGKHVTRKARESALHRKV